MPKFNHLLISSFIHYGTANLKLKTKRKHLVAAKTRLFAVN